MAPFIAFGNEVNATNVSWTTVYVALNSVDAYVHSTVSVTRC